MLRAAIPQALFLPVLSSVFLLTGIPLSEADPVRLTDSIGENKEATETLTRTFNLLGQAPWRANEWPNVAIVVISWEDLLAVFAKCEAEPFLNELDQFQAMYDVLNYSIEPLRGRSDLLRWRDIESEKGTFFKLVDRITRNLTTNHDLLPLHAESRHVDCTGS